PTPAPWEEMRAAFRWDMPARYNIAEEVCERWARAEPDREALIYLRPEGDTRTYTYAELSRASSRLANALLKRGLRAGDRCAVLLPQTPETVLTHLACYKIGVIVVPLFTLFGEDGLRFRLSDAGVRAVVTDGANLGKLFNIKGDLPDLDLIYSIDERPRGVYGFWHELGRAPEACEMAESGPDDPAFLSYTSGTTGPPKGALHGHRVLLGHLPGFVTHHDFAPQPGDRIWTPADWAWMGGLMNVLMPGLALGIPVVAHRMAKFEAERAFSLMRELKVRNAFLPPTALKLMRQTSERIDTLRSVGSGGEALGADLLAWGRDALGVTINEFYGQTECNLVLGNSATVMAPRPGSTGKPVPGHEVAIMDGQGDPVPPGQPGEIAVRRDDPGMFLRYWNNPKKTEEKFLGDWMRTGDEGHMDADGYVHFASRSDDVITSSGYRIGPTEVEECLTGHPDVVMSAVIGVPDPVRTESIKAFVVLRPGAGTDGLAEALISRVRERISPHVAPRAVAFVPDLPMTATGKIMRRTLKAQEES
ncbi:MAG: AMP-binding protein, partial [Pseudomonadota bacterium]